jgi:hypothetical protein
MTFSICPGCGLQALPGGIPPNGALNASPECWAMHAELVGFELGNALLVGRYHQLTVDAYGAQHAGPPGGRRSYVAYSLAGLYLALERGWTGIQVRSFHAKMGRPDTTWPELRRPLSTGVLTVADVVAAGARLASADGHAETVERWARSVWDAWADQHEAVRALTHRLLERAQMGG